ncbi:MAG TPA: bifunctional pyr operon transcriptional regulator/uracil phosphoribosyltransferase PyrR [Gammaproteobacteria bacterium]|nr:bifunctional pyr operon transcriptional regulator/uracil phosphoribosyltransferase PyrR [Gammaproteobacteria bacterium]
MKKLPTKQPAAPVPGQTPIPQPEALIRQLQQQIPPAGDLLMIGIHSGGVIIAQRLHKALAIAEPLGMLDINFYRDDFSQVGLQPVIRSSHLPWDFDARNILLVDDILHTGRTVRAAMNALFDYGRPASIRLAVLLDRGGRELPVQPDYLGLLLPLQAQQHIKLIQDQALYFLFRDDPPCR